MNGMNRRDLITKSLAAVALFAAKPGSILAEAVGIKRLDLTPTDVCTLTCRSTLGPCFYEGRVARRDITEGQGGLPTLLSLLVVNADTCQPVPGAAIDIWHANANGLYSAPISNMCTDGNTAARNSTFLRGIQTTDADGWAHFNTVYPGWYSGRTPHIHSTVRVNSSEMVTTQFFFPDDLSTKIYTAHPAYTARGRADTTNTRDNVIGGAAARVTPFLFQPKLIGTSQLFALKVIAIRSSATTCNA
jgi:protocatechuate 3,4-dioxygenase beta subunit